MKATHEGNGQGLRPGNLLGVHVAPTDLDHEGWPEAGKEEGNPALGEIGGFLNRMSRR